MTEERMDLSDLEMEASKWLDDCAERGRDPHEPYVVAGILERVRDAARTEEHRGCDCGPSGHRYSDCPAYQAGLSEGVAQGIKNVSAWDETVLGAQVVDLRARLEKAIAERDALREALFGQKLFLERVLAKLTSHAEHGGPHGSVSGYHASVDVPEIPEWELRRTLDEVRAALRATDGKGGSNE